MNKIIFSVVDNLVKWKVIGENDISVYRYGLEILLLSIIEILSILLLAIWVGNFFETILYFTTFIPIRIFAGGYHANTRLRCYLLSIISYGLFSLCLFVVPTFLWLNLSKFIAITNLIIIFCFSPVIQGTIDKQEIQHYREVSIAIAFLEFILIYIFCFMQLRTLSFIIALGLLEESIAVIAGKIKIEGNMRYERN